jgi:MFS superfamily sulfate permease-like transporter
VLTGFKAGITIVIVVDQIPKLLGIHVPRGTFLQSLAGTVTHLPQASLVTLALGVGLLVLIVGLERFAPKSPAPLVAVAAGIAVSAAFGIQQYGVELVGEVRSGLPSFALPDVSLARALAPAALGIALMSFVETAAAGRAFVQKGEPMPTENRELLALGLANVAGSLFHNMPAGGGTSQTAVNRAAGARTQWAGLTTALAVLATLLFLAPTVALIPQPALAAVVVATSMGLFQASEFAAIRHIRAREFWWAVVATAGVVLLGTLNGILVAVALSVTALFYEACRPPVYLIGRRRGTDIFEPVSPASPELETFPGLLLLRTEGGISFANAHRVGAEMWRLVGHSHPQVLAFDMSAVPDIEYTALKGLIDTDEKLRAAGTELWLVALNPRVRDVVDRSPLADARRRGRIFGSAGEAVDAYVGQRGGSAATNAS